MKGAHYGVEENGTPKLTVKAGLLGGLCGQSSKSAYGFVAST
jgi:hypothetical protein